MPEHPDWQPLDGVTVPAPPAGRVVALVATRGAVGEGWAPEAAVDLVRAWALDGARVTLVDAGLAHPSLHTALGIPNREGLVDAALYGASMPRVAHVPNGERFLLVTAGTPVTGGDAVPEQARWRRIAGGMAEADVTLALYLPEGAGPSEAFLAAATDLVVLSGPDEPLPEVVGDRGAPVLAVVGRAEPVARGPASERSPGRGPRLVGVAPATGTGGGFSKMMVFVVVAVVIAAALGYFLSMGTG